MAEKFHYYVVFSFLTPEGEFRMAARDVIRDRPIETIDDIKGLKAECGFADLRALTPIDWKRIQ